MNENALNANVGHRLRTVRLSKNVKQADCARELGVSPAYLNLIEKGKRVTPFPLLWKALRFFQVDPEEFMSQLGEGRVDEALAKLLDEPLLKTLDLDQDSLQSLSAEPKLAGTVAALFNLYKNTRSQLENVMAQLSSEQSAGRATPGDPRLDYSPFDEVSDFLQAHQNYFPELEEEAESLRKDFGNEHPSRRESADRILGSGVLMKMLEARFGIVTRIAEAPQGSSVVRRVSLEQKILEVSPALTEQPLKFQIAATLGLLTLDKTRLVERIVGAKTKHAETPRLIKVNLANYFAGALMLPYGDFFKEVQRTRYDIELLASIFGVTYETVAHRVCNLADVKRKGLPFHFIRTDIAGNISKRYSGTGIKFASSGNCGKWAVHLAFLNPSQLTRQYSSMPDGTTYFDFAKVQLQPIEGTIVRGTAYSIGLGTHAENAKYLAYGLPTTDLKRDAVPIGVSCRFCERTDCNQRSAASYRFAFSFDEYTKKDCFFSPLVNSDLSERKRR
ncbi:MAG: short-chain fatty acyl-CoA regulator family protein [Archangium sp.]|nr:short-chain fatty acyl-CoA regulator family protein [Archangium sp.]